MAIVPDGFPLWTRTSGISVYGGSLNKTNYQRLGVVNPRTDVGAEGFTRITGDMVAAGRAAPFAVITFLNSDSSPAAPTVETVLMMTGVLLASSYVGNLAPTGFPSAARNGAGDVTFTFASTYTDEYGISAAFSLHSAKCSAHGDTYFSPQWEIVTATTLRIRCLTSAGAASSDKRVTLQVW
jgi:hypothetical protein